MGIPDFVKFIARSSPSALCRVPKGSSRHEPLIFDFILIDATNAAQTLGLDTLRAFLNPDHVMARSAVIFALDSQRDRSGTARAHRHALVGIGDLDVHVQKLCGQLADAYCAQQGCNNRLGAGSGANPYVLMSGRGVAGEADYKLLDLQRCLVTCAIASGAAVLPTFLFISEDSDVLCGALCGPAPQQVSIATKLQDVLFEPSILRLDRVLAFVATCTDAFYAENEKEAAAAAAAKMKAMTERNAAKATRANAFATAPATKHAGEHHSDEEVELSVKDTAVATATATAARDDGVVRRRKQDGPMVSTGVRIELADSSDDDQPEHVETKPTKVPTATAGASAKAPVSEMGEVPIDGGECVEGASAAPTEGELLVSSIMHTSCVDMVFLFMIVMGNAVNVPSLVRGATKVDSGSCWQAYCKHKYKNLSAADAETGRALLTPSINTHSTNRGTLVLNCHFLHSILDAVHYADAEPRPPVEEEKSSAITYLSNAVYATLRYIVGCNLDRTPTLKQTFLDSRPLSETPIMLPSLSAVMWVLGQESARTFSFPLHGLAKKELLVAASSGASAANDAADASSKLAANHATFARDASSSTSDLDVGEHLVAPAASNAWAVRGARTSNVSLATLMVNFTSGVDRASSAARSAHYTAAGMWSAQLPSVSEMLKKALQMVSPASLAKANLLFYLMTVWTYALGLGVRRMATLTKAAASVTKAEVGDPELSLAQSPSSAGTAKTLQVAPDTTPVSGHYVYSFELRRMAPVLQAATSQPPSFITAASGRSAIPGRVDSTASSSSEKSAAQQAIFAALGVSYDYSKTPRAPANVVNLPRCAMDEEDIAELQRLRKVAKKERALSALVVDAVPGKKRSANADDKDSASSDNDDGDIDRTRSTKRAKEAKNGTSKAKKRLGKRERLKQQKATAKAAAAEADGGSPRHAGRAPRVHAPVKAATS
ncbi:conserved hypothetical protein [Leishmania major strain Friedlin]|uniref:Uncharacterized protein n=1 Tax=Leishmania major TaxID=5664 RepID=Q4Q1S6_LEIMA|nr:conserved hypothetical protein [Leishmania major strain Friedlin]CAG9583670.1 hypothetical_protein_-_conserved [Leishmania major strain Friedlin]CAJ09103.1 conserved hypothetical protein [Leishmania major strain Friedlin]|eukprot:XP_001686722.1 conserved hypothetical protein [Leishmania major strain Friedlin]